MFAYGCSSQLCFIRIFFHCLALVCSKSIRLWRYFTLLRWFSFWGSAGSTQCKDILKLFQNSCKLWSVPLAVNKTVEPTEVLIFLGIEFDTMNMVMRLPDEKLIELRNKIESCLACTKISLRDLQSLIGTLNFACQVIVPGRAFCRRLIDATCNVRRSHHKIRATLAMKDDLRVWLSFLFNYNGTTVILDQF